MRTLGPVGAYVTTGMVPYKYRTSTCQQFNVLRIFGAEWVLMDTTKIVFPMYHFVCCFTCIFVYHGSRCLFLPVVNMDAVNLRTGHVKINP